MVERSLVFPTSEYRQRTTRLQAEMATRGVDALLLTTPADVFYTTGFLTRFWESPARPWFVVVPAEGAPLAVIPAIGADLMASTWIEDIRTWGAPDPTDNGMALLGEALRDRVPDGGHIGIPMGIETHLRMPLADFFELQASLGQRELVDGTACVQRVREIKSEAELSKVRDICAIAGLAFDEVADFAHPGSGLDAVFRAFQVACLRNGADWVSYLAGGAGQRGYGNVISPADKRVLAVGDILMLDTGAVRDGYFCDFDRNFAVSVASDAVLRAHEALWHATEDVLAAIRPGQRACDVHRMICDALLKHGAEPGSGRLGHGLGISLTKWPSISAVDETPLRAGMVLTLEPSAVTGLGRMMVHEENFVLRDNGAELLSPRAPETLPVVAA
jgi:Xaa-Pro aminopeptidase